MAMIPLHTLLPDVAKRETREASLEGNVEIPDGDYGFVELYCDDVTCDCRRVLIMVFGRTMGTKPLAVINHGWESPAFYESWIRIKDFGKDHAGAKLDPLNPQSQYAPYLLSLFFFLLEDPVYADRLKRHYESFKRSLRRRRRGGHLKGARKLGVGKRRRPHDSLL